MRSDYLRQQLQTPNPMTTVSYLFFHLYIKGEWSFLCKRWGQNRKCLVTCWLKWLSRPLSNTSGCPSWKGNWVSHGSSWQPVFLGFPLLPLYVFFIVFSLLLTFSSITVFIESTRLSLTGLRWLKWASWKVRQLFFSTVLCAHHSHPQLPRTAAVKTLHAPSPLPTHEHTPQDWAEAPQMSKLIGVSSFFFDCACAHHSHSHSSGPQW